MGKSSKIYINYKSSPDECAAPLREADENDLRLLSMLLLCADADGCADTAGLEALLDMEKTDVVASLKFWKGAGILSGTSSKRAAKQKAETAHADIDATSVHEHAHKGGVIAHIVGVEEYSNDELADVIEKNVGAEFIDEAQKVMGKMFNKNEVGKLVGIVDQMGFEEEAVLAILSYCVRLEKKSLSYAEKIAIALHDEGILTSEAVHAQIDIFEKRNSAVGKVKFIFGFGSRKLSAAEERYFATWTEDWGFGIDIITKAYELTVDTIHEPAPKYTNGILKKWYENGLRTVDEIDRYIESEKQKISAKPAPVTSARQVKTPAKNNEMEDWFEQRLRQSFGE